MCRHLGMPLLEVDFVAQYWQRVFQPFLDQCAAQTTRSQSHQLAVMHALAW